VKKLLLKLTLLLAPVAIVVVSVNWYADPANIFSGPAYINKIATILSAGNNVDNIANYNERLLQKELLLRQKVKNEVVIMGSSRIMEMGGDIFPGRSLRNIGVSHANINDLLALTGLLDSLNLLPEEMVINADPFLIAKGDKGTGEWKSLYDWHGYFVNRYCKDCENKMGGNSHSLSDSKYYSLINFEYFQKSVEFLAKQKNKNVVDVGHEKPRLYGRYSNGSIAYPDSYTHPDTLLTANVAQKTGELIIEEVDDDKYEALKCLVAFLKTRKVKVTLLMLPFHPAYFEVANKKQNNVFNRYEKLFASFAAENELPLRGSFSPAKCNVGQSVFYDPYHCSGDAVKKIFLQQ
jgi:hypothetical protein